MLKSPLSLRSAPRAHRYCRVRSIAGSRVHQLYPVHICAFRPFNTSCLTVSARMWHDRALPCFPIWRGRLAGAESHRHPRLDLSQAPSSLHIKTPLASPVFFHSFYSIEPNQLSKYRISLFPLQPNQPTTDQYPKSNNPIRNSKWQRPCRRMCPQVPDGCVPFSLHLPFKVTSTCVNHSILCRLSSSAVPSSL